MGAFILQAGRCGADGRAGGLHHAYQHVARSAGVFTAGRARAHDAFLPGVLVPVPLPPLLHKRTQSALRLQPQQIWQLTYEGKPAFYLVEPCCDRMNTLHDAAGYARCAPTGGISGKGDGRCPAPLPPSDQMRLVWERAR